MNPSNKFDDFQYFEKDLLIIFSLIHDSHVLKSSKLILGGNRVLLILFILFLLMWPNLKCHKKKLFSNTYEYYEIGTLLSTLSKYIFSIFIPFTDTFPLLI
jgi:hypothetical protein